MEDIKQDPNATEIDFLALFKILKAEKTIIALCTFFATSLGALYTFIRYADTEFEAVGKLMPEVVTKSSDGLGGLYEVLKKYSGDIDLYYTEVTRPEIYEEIINTKAFNNYLLSKTVENIKSEKLSFKTYFYNNLADKSSFYQKEKQDSASNARAIEYACQQNIRKRIEITTSRRNNLVSVSVKMPDPVVAANIANFTIDYLLDYITKYRTAKVRQELLFVENLIKNSKREDFPKEVLNSLSVSALQLKIQIQENTPIIQVLEYAQIPIFTSNPAKFTIILPCLFLGLIIGITVAIVKNSNYRIVL